jgi:hypothetical protein
MRAKRLHQIFTLRPNLHVQISRNHKLMGVQNLRIYSIVLKMKKDTEAYHQ